MKRIGGDVGGIFTDLGRQSTLDIGATELLRAERRATQEATAQPQKAGTQPK